jgi:hypothetical protein
LAALMMHPFEGFGEEIPNFMSLEESKGNKNENRIEGL